MADKINPKPEGKPDAVAKEGEEKRQTIAELEQSRQAQARSRDIVGGIESPMPGGDGNREFLISRARACHEPPRGPFVTVGGGAAASAGRGTSGRAGGGEELGGIRGVMHYMQRTAIQGSPDMLSAINQRWVPGSTQTTPKAHPFTQPYGALSLGDTLHTEPRTVTLDDIEHFARFTGDTFYAHMDDAAAKRNPFFPGRVAHGYLLLSFAAGLFVEPNEGPVLANTGLDGLRFLKPVEPGDAIKVALTVKHKTPRNDDYGEVRWHVALTNQNDEAVAEYELLTMNAFATA